MAYRWHTEGFTNSLKADRDPYSQSFSHQTKNQLDYEAIFAETCFGPVLVEHTYPSHDSISHPVPEKTFISRIQCPGCLGATMVGLMAFAIRAVTARNMDSVHGRWHKRFSAGTGAIKQPSLQERLWRLLNIH